MHRCHRSRPTLSASAPTDKLKFAGLGYAAIQPDRSFLSSNRAVCKAAFTTTCWEFFRHSLVTRRHSSNIQHLLHLFYCRLGSMFASWRSHSGLASSACVCNADPKLSKADLVRSSPFRDALIAILRPCSRQSHCAEG